MKITFLGDSLTWGEFGGSYIEALRPLLPEHTLINAGVGGDTIVNLWQRLDDVLDQEPDFIFVMVGGNDAISYTQPGTRPYYKTTKKIDEGFVTPQQFGHVYRDLLTEIALNHIESAVGLEPVEYSPELRTAVQQYNSIARDVAQSMQVPVLDLDAHFTPDLVPDRDPADLHTIQEIGQRVKEGWNDFERERRRFGYTFTFDGLHLMPETAQVMAQVIANFLDR